MKKLFVTTLAILASGAAYALPVGNPSEASFLSDGLFFEGNCGDPCDPCISWCDKFSFRLGFYGDYVFNRHLETNDGDNVIEHTSLYTNAGYFAVNFCNRFDVFTTVGATNFYLDTNGGTFAAIFEGSRFDLESRTACPSWSVGGHWTIWELGCTSLGLEGQYFSANPDIRRITVAATSSTYPDDTYSARYHEWQVGLGIAHRINIFVPYVAVKWSGARWNLGDRILAIGGDADLAQMRDLRNQKSWGYAVGVSLIDCEKAALTVEGRFADEKAVYVNGQVRF